MAEADTVWRLQDAKARFSEVVRRAREEGPQHVTVRGEDAVVVVASGEWRARDAESRKELFNVLTGAGLPKPADDDFDALDRLVADCKHDLGRAFDAT
ncbi:MAG: prevent-host-death protein [Rhodospirillales bacterium]|nr:prevent-host-death protein [Rhodospirillales bacterium]